MAQLSSWSGRTAPLLRITVIIRTIWISATDRFPAPRRRRGHYQGQQSRRRQWSRAVQPSSAVSWCAETLRRKPLATSESTRCGACSRSPASTRRAGPSLSRPARPVRSEPLRARAQQPPPPRPSGRSCRPVGLLPLRSGQQLAGLALRHDAGGMSMTATLVVALRKQQCVGGHGHQHPVADRTRIGLRLPPLCRPHVPPTHCQRSSLISPNPREHAKRSRSPTPARR